MKFIDTITSLSGSDWVIAEDRYGGITSTTTTGTAITSGWPDSTRTCTITTNPFIYDIPAKDIAKAIERNTYGGNEGKKMKGISSANFKKVIFNEPATIIMWTDGTKTIVKAMEDDVYDPMVGLAMCICKKVLGPEYKRIFRKYEKQYDEQLVNEVSMSDIRNELDNILTKAKQLKESWGFFESGDANGEDSKI